MRPLRKILAWQSLLLALLPFLVMAPLGLAWFFPQFKGEIEAEQRQLAAAIASQTDGYLSSSMERIEDMANLLKMGDHGWQSTQKILDAHVRDTGVFRSIYVAGADGRVQAVALAGGKKEQAADLTGIDLSGNNLIRQARSASRPVWSDAFLSLVGGGLSVALAVRSDDSVVVGELRLDLLGDYLRRIAVSPDQLIMVLDRRGQVIADQQGFYTAQQLNLSNILSWRDGEPDTSRKTIHFDLGGDSMVGSLVMAPSLRWYVLAAYPAAVAYRPFWSVAGIFALALAATLLAGVAASLLLSRRLAAKFEALAAQARSISSGEQAAAWPTSRISEFQALSADLRQMAASLRQREESLRREKEFTETLIDALPGAFFLFDDQLRLRRWNKNFELATGGTAEELKGMPLGLRLASPGQPEEAVAKALTVLREGAPMQTESSVIHKDGHEAPFIFHSVRIQTDHGPMVMGVGLDITERKRAEQTVMESEARFRRIVDTANEGVCECDSRRRITFVNRKMAAMLGCLPEDMVGGRLDEFIHPDDLPAFHRSMEMRGRGQGESYERRYLRKDGGHIWVLVNAAPIFDQDGAYAGSFGMYTDVTERKRAEEALYQSEEKFRLAFNTSPDAININRLSDGLYVDINQGFTDLTGYTAEDAVGRTSLEIDVWVDPLDRKRLVGGLVEKGYYENLEAKFRRKDGSLTTALMSARVLTLGGVPHIISITRDISERIRAEEEKSLLERQLRQAQKMEAVGALAGGIAHDFNNILAIILGNADLALEDIPVRGPLAEKLDRIQTACQRGKDLVGQILAFARQRERQPILVEPAMIWGESLKLLKSTLPANISIRHNLPKGRWRVLADPTELHQILLNLCANAAHAMRESGGELSITLDEVGFDGVSVPVGLEPGDYMRLNVGDTGHGIEQAFLERIFEPYYSTKPLGEGTGLGLAVVHGLVKAHGGAITVVSQVGQGTTFSVFLPLAQTQAAAPAPSEQQALPRGVGRLMLVDDEPELLAMQSKSLERLGYRVSAYENAALAWRAFREDPQGFDLVVTDQATPEMTGLQLADHIRSLPSGAPIILCTGFLERRLDEEISRVGIREVLIKPFSRSHLALAVQRALVPRPADGIN